MDLDFFSSSVDPGMCWKVSQFDEIPHHYVAQRCLTLCVKFLLVHPSDFQSAKKTIRRCLIDEFVTHVLRDCDPVLERNVLTFVTFVRAPLGHIALKSAWDYSRLVYDSAKWTRFVCYWSMTLNNSTWNPINIIFLFPFSTPKELLIVCTCA